MTPPGIRFPFRLPPSTPGPSMPMPFLPITLSLKQRVVVEALMDTGSAVCVMPHSLGIQLGGDWNNAPLGGQLAGNLAQVQSRVLIVDAFVASFPAKKL